MEVRKIMKGRRLLAAAVSLTMLLGMVVQNSIAVAAASRSSVGSISYTLEDLHSIEEGDYVSVIATPQNRTDINPDYDRSFDNYEVKSSEGFLHPGILMNREELNIMRDMVWIGAEPWTTIYEELLEAPYASLDYVPEGPYEVIASDAQTYPLDRASTAVYEETLLWYITGNQDYADKAIGIIMSWANTVTKDSKQDHIRMGIAIHKLTIAAEILRYTPSSGWTDENTESFNAFLELVNPSIDKAFQYYNQGGYALMGYMAKQIFQDNWDGYEIAVERLAYNSDYGWKSENSVNYSLSAMIFNNGSFVEMGRDQEHAWDDLGVLSMCIKTTYVQKTKVNSKGKIVKLFGSNLYDFENEKILKAAAVWQKYCIGEDITYIANKNAWGQHTEWSVVSENLRGRTLMWLPSLYYYFYYTKGCSDDDVRTILEPTSVDESVDEFTTYGNIYDYITLAKDLDTTTYLRGTNVDFPDFEDLTFTPLKAATSIRENYTGPEAEAENDSCPSYNRYLANQFTGCGNGAKDETSYTDGRNGTIVTEADVDEEGVTHFVTSDVNNGEWISYTIDFEEEFGSNLDTLIYCYGVNCTNNPYIDVYVGDYVESPEDEDYASAVENGYVGTLELGPTGGYSSFEAFSGEMANSSLLTGKKTLYFYYRGSNNIYAFHGRCLWFKFVSASAFEELELNTSMEDGESIKLENVDFDSGFGGVVMTYEATSDGTISLYVDEESQANLVAGYSIDNDENTLTYGMSDTQTIIGNHDIYLNYTGQAKLTLNTIQFLDKSYSSDEDETSEDTETEESGESVEADTIDTSLIEENLLTLYLYDKDLYERYISAKDLYNSNSENEEYEANLKDILEEYNSTYEVYTKVKFEYRFAGSGSGQIAMYSDTTTAAKTLTLSDEDLEKQIAITDTLSYADKKVKETDWISFSDVDGNSLRLTGSHELTVNLSNSALRLVAIILSNEDETITKIIDPLSVTSAGDNNYTHFCVNTRTSDWGDAGSFDWEVRGCASWLKYSIENSGDLSEYAVNGNKLSKFPYVGQTGEGISFDLKASLFLTYQEALDYLDAEDMYTAASYESFMTAYSEAYYAITNYEAMNLSLEQSIVLADALLAAISNLEFEEELFEIEEDTTNSNNIAFDYYGNSDLNYSFLSINPSVAAVSGGTISFLLNIRDDIENPFITVEDFGYRALRGSSEYEATEIEPKLDCNLIEINLISEEENLYRISYEASNPGNYRLKLKVEAEDFEKEEIVELVSRNDLERSDLAATYVRMRFASFRNDEEKQVLLYLVKDGEATSDSNLIATISSYNELDATYVLSDWVPITLPENYDADSTYQLVAYIAQRNTHIDFFEFATESYTEVFPTSYEDYPLSESGVLRVEAEHYDYNSYSGYEAVDFNGRNGWENGTPGEGTGNIGTTSSLKTLTVKYEGFTLAESLNTELSQIDISVGKDYMFVGDATALTISTNPVDATDSISISNSNRNVMNVTSDLQVEATCFGQASVLAISGSCYSNSLNIYIADSDYLMDILSTYEEYILNYANEYMTYSYADMYEKYNQAKEALEVQDAKQVYEATLEFIAAIDARVYKANTFALDTYLEIASRLIADEYTLESYTSLLEKVLLAESLSQDSSQEEINDVAGQIQLALLALVEIEAKEADYSRLNELIAEAEVIINQGQGTCSVDSWENLLLMYELAIEEASIENNTKIRIDIAIEELESAISNLTEEKASIIDASIIEDAPAEEQVIVAIYSNSSDTTSDTSLSTASVQSTSTSAAETAIDKAASDNELEIEASNTETNGDRQNKADNQTEDIGDEESADIKENNKNETNEINDEKAPTNGEKQEEAFNLKIVFAIGAVIILIAIAALYIIRHNKKKIQF